MVVLQMGLMPSLLTAITRVRRTWAYDSVEWLAIFWVLVGRSVTRRVRQIAWAWAKPEAGATVVFASVASKFDNLRPRHLICLTHLTDQVPKFWFWSSCVFIHCTDSPVHWTLSFPSKNVETFIIIFFSEPLLEACGTNDLADDFIFFFLLLFCASLDNFLFYRSTTIFWRIPNAFWIQNFWFIRILKVHSWY